MAKNIEQTYEWLDKQGLDERSKQEAQDWLQSYENEYEFHGSCKGVNYKLFRQKTRAMLTAYPNWVAKLESLDIEEK